jgi:hypothetical protein
VNGWRCAEHRPLERLRTSLGEADAGQATGYRADFLQRPEAVVPGWLCRPAPVPVPELADYGLRRDDPLRWPALSTRVNDPHVSLSCRAGYHGGMSDQGIFYRVLRAGGWFAVCLLLLVVAMSVSSPLNAAGPNTALSTLARLLTVEDEVTRWGFAGIVLDELLSAYEIELEDSFEPRTRSANRQRRLNHWQRATEGYISRLYRMRSALDDGEPFELFVDAQSQIVIAIGEDVVLAGGPHSDFNRQIEAQVVRQFCEYNDCGWLGLGTYDARPRSFAPAGRGRWSQPLNGRLRYEVGGRFVFEFSPTVDRLRVADQADQAVDELQLLADEFKQVQQQLIAIEWLAIAEDLVGIRRHGNVVLNASGDYFELSLPILVRLSVADWRRVVAWVRQGAHDVLSFPHADALF